MIKMKKQGVEQLKPSIIEGHTKTNDDVANALIAPLRITIRLPVSLQRFLPD